MLKKFALVALCLVALGLSARNAQAQWWGHVHVTEQGQDIADVLIVIKVNGQIVASGETLPDGYFDFQLGAQPQSWEAILDSRCVNPDPNFYSQVAGGWDNTIDWDIEDYI